MARIALAAALAIALAPPSIAVAKTSSDTTPGANFAQYRSFYFVNPMAPAGMNPVTYERIRMGIEQGLAGKGYAIATGSGDLAVIITVGARDRTDINTWGAFGRQVDVHQYTEGQLSVDAFDAGTKQPLWHGQITRTISSKIDPAKVDKEVGKLMAQFPARPAG